MKDMKNSVKNTVNICRYRCYNDDNMIIIDEENMPWTG